MYHGKTKATIMLAVKSCKQVIPPFDHAWNETRSKNHEFFIVTTRFLRRLWEIYVCQLTKKITTGWFFPRTRNLNIIL